MTAAASRPRIESIDTLRGIVMVIMALDHVRDYFHLGSFSSDPTDLATTTPFLFFTRILTHFCAPVFVFLSGTSAFLYGVGKSKAQLFKFLFTRGVWLVFLEVVVNNFIWTFDVTYSVQIFQVIFAIGFSMICLSGIIFLPPGVILFLGVLLVAGHNTLDGIVMEGQSGRAVIWYLLHQENALVYDSGHMIFLHYPVIPWVGLLSLGYLLGAFYQSNFSAATRQKWLVRLGLGCVILFLVVRGFNRYGDLVPWTVQDTFTKTVLSFFKVTKYPPSLAYLCFTMGPAFLFLYGYENVRSKFFDFFLVFGRVPLFYYFLHMLFIHVGAILGMLIFGGNWQDMILTSKGFRENDLKDYGYSLLTVYMVWIGLVLVLYPFCKKYMDYKAANRAKWWLSYL